jgi:hypothetical protein
MTMTMSPATGMPCTTVCSGGATAADLSTIRNTCAKQGREKYMAAGGDAADWAQAQESGAETKATDTLSTCFDNLMSTNSQTWETITPALEMTYRRQCEGNAESEFIRNGGDPTMWHEAQTTGAASASAATMSTCFEDKMTTLGYSYETVTMAQQESIQSNCDTDARKKFISSGGDATVYQQNLKKGAAAATATVMDNCFETAFAAANYNHDGTCGVDSLGNPVTCYKDVWMPDSLGMKLSDMTGKFTPTKTTGCCGRC